MTRWFWVAGLICLVSLGGLIIIALMIWFGCFGPISLNTFHGTRLVLAISAVVYGIYSAVRLVANVKPGQPLPVTFVPELIALSTFWILVPPVWFFLEYFAVANNCIRDFPPDPNLKSVKDYADYASKVWAGVLALLLALIALKK